MDHDILGEVNLIIDAMEGLIEDITENNVIMPYANDSIRRQLAQRLLDNQSLGVGIKGIRKRCLILCKTVTGIVEMKS